MTARATRRWFLRRLPTGGALARWTLSAPPADEQAPGEGSVPVEPLRRLVDLHGGPRLAAAVLGRGSGAVDRAYYRAVARGRVSVYVADELAVRLLGRHPSLVWGAQWWSAIA